MFGLNSDLFYIPSFYAHTLNGILLLAAFVVLYKNFAYIKNVDKYRLITLILLFSSAAGKHITGQTLAIDGGVSAVII